jgi:Spirocyclase AveC-like
LATRAAPAERRATGPATAEAVPEIVREKNEKAKARLWILNGAFWLGLMTYVWTAWVLSGDFTTNKIGRGEEPDWYVTMIRSWEVFALIVTLAILWYFVIRPKIKTGRFTFDGLFFLGCAAICFQEPWINWTSLQFLYSTTSINFGSFTGHIPGWSSPNSQLVPLSLWALSAYFWLVGIPAYCGSRFMGWLRVRDPQIGSWRMVAYAYLAFCVFDLILESFITRTQLFSYGSVVPELSLWAGTDHQFPLYETASWAGTYTVLASLHFFRDDQGRSLPERGIASLRIRSGRLQTFARYLAIMGVCQLAILFTYNIPYVYWGQHAEMADVFIQREWRTAGVCGPKTPYVCPDPDYPIARKGSPTNRIDLSSP